MNERLKNLYKTIILKHNNKPVSFEKNESATHVLKAYNPVCGDRFELFFEVKNGVIEDLTFHGFGCAISKASTSVLVKNLKGSNFTEAKLLCEKFQKVTEPEAEKITDLDEEFEAFSAAKDFPGRLKCATLSWDEMLVFLNEKLKMEN